ncbi:MAG: winged helix-turn-helix transcriptional regulator [Chloroflexi bacterium]|nr:winged helix-turn-helix transcriptional regulator [Chloroflexota bacterium]
MANLDPNAALSLIYKALAHPVRLQILELVAREECCVCHLADSLQKPQPYISQQLAVLRKAGLVGDRRDGLMIYYQAAGPEALALLAAGRALARQVLGQEVTLPPLPQAVSPTCTCPKCQSARAADATM